MWLLASAVSMVSSVRGNAELLRFAEPTRIDSDLPNNAMVTVGYPVSLVVTGTAVVATCPLELTKAVAAIKAAKQTKPPTRQRPAMTLLGKKAPEYTVTTVDGLKTQVAGKRDKPQVLFCYASWCGFCKRSLPWIESLHEKYKDKGVEVLAINLDDRGQGGRARTEEQSLKHYRDMKLSMPMTMTSAGNDTKKIGAAYKALSFPTLFVVGTTGEVEAVHVGAKQGLADTVGKQLDVLLAGKTRKDFAK